MSLNVTGPARTYFALTLGSLIALAACLFVRTEGNLVLCILPVAFGLLGLVGRYTVFPILMVCSTCYFLIFPQFVLFYANRDNAGASHFRLLDLLLVGSVLVYWVSLFRGLSFSHQLMPLELKDRRQAATEPPLVRCAEAVPDDEFPRLALQLGLVLLVGQLIWFGVVWFRMVPSQFPPIRWSINTGERLQVDPNSGFLMFAALFLMAFLGVGMLVWYWRWSRLTPLEADQYLREVEWQFARRELQRQETWRAAALPKRAKPVTPPAARRGCAWLSVRTIVILVSLAIVVMLGWYFFVSWLLRRL